MRIATTSDIGHWFRNDSVNKRCGANLGPITQHLVGQGPCALPGVRYGIGGPSGTPAPTERLQGVRWVGDRKGRPYGGLQGVR